LTQIPHALHSSVFIAGFGHSDRFTGEHFFPVLSKTAPLGQALPQTPQSTQRFSLIVCRLLFSPATAKTGQFFAQAPQPVQASLIE
jgi:hypothetical protein